MRLTMRLLALSAAALSVCNAANTWDTLAAVPGGAIHEQTAVAVSNSQIAILGGVSTAGATIDTVQLYDIPKNTWSKAAPLPVALNHANCAVVDGKIYVLGGMAVRGGAWVGTEKSWVYDPPTDKWTALASMPVAEARGSAAMGVYNKTIWLASGKTGSSGISADTVSAFDTMSGKWLDTIPAIAKRIPEGRDHGGGAVIGTKFYQVGGSLNGIPNRKDTVFVLDLEDLSKGWITAKGRMPTPRRGISVAAVGTKIYAFGGEGNTAAGANGVFNQSEVYDTVTDTWASLPPMKVPRHGTYAVAVEGKIYIPGGGIAQGTHTSTTTFDVFTP